MSLKTIKNEDGIYVELPRDKINFVSKDAGIIFDLSMENERLEMENEELKKQLEEYKEELMIATKMEIKQIDETTFLGIDYFQDKCIMLKTQQQEFIKYLEDRQFIPSITGEDFEEDYTITEVLQKYKEIIGVSDE